MNHKVLYFSHGDKGGVGKSVVASVMTDWLQERGHCLAVVDGDESNNDVGRRFLDAEGIYAAALRLNDPSDAEASIARFSNWLEARPQIDRVVINLPANASETLDGQAEILRDVAEALGFKMRVVYSVGKSVPAAQMLQKSFTSGLMSVVHPGDRMVLFPEFDARPEDTAWYGIKDDCVAHEAVFPALRPAEAFNQVLRLEMPYSAIVRTRPPGITLHTVISLKRWLDNARKALAPIMDIEGEDK
ncbi:hypothetical protein [Sulfuricystis thermophila]|uniref:hypothetical protein n=1 Tax=Sulfuricystis thermophila TaxID=2496847 RepID=UPI001035BDA8|nr:hypothetical protein [Sulfuricystis thermophila]